MNQISFWNRAWGLKQRIDEVKLIDLLMHQSAVEFTYRIIGNLQGKKLLEIGCGSGVQTIDFVKKGAVVTAIDISEESLALTKQILNQNRMKAEVKKIDAERMDLPSERFDLVYINCVLMHADQDKTIQESLRVLKPGGFLIFKESLKGWLFAFPYRVFSPYKKSKPHYITLSKIKQLGAIHREFYLLSSSLAFLFYLLPNKTRAHHWFSLLEPVDHFLLRNFPLLRALAWVSMGVIKKS